MEHLSSLNTVDLMLLKKEIIRGLSNIFSLDTLISYPITKDNKEISFNKIKKLFNNSEISVESIIKNMNLYYYLYDLINKENEDENVFIITTDKINDQYVKSLFKTYDISSCLLYKIYDKGNLKEILVGFILGEKRFSSNIENINKYRFLFESANYVFKNNLSERENGFDDGQGHLLRISHDLNNILTPALGAIELIKSKEDSDIREEMKLIELCIKDAVDIINLGRVSDQKEVPNMDLVEVDKIITDSFLLARNKFHKYNIVTKVDLKANSKVLGYSTELREVFINIINNAIEAMPNGGTLKLSSYTKDGYIFVKIIDSGIGIKDEHKLEIFNPFFTTKGSKGTGIGLSICKEIINKHRGDISIESTYGDGSCFCISLPLAEYNHNHNHKEETDILIVDDDYRIRFIISSLVKKVFSGSVEHCGPNEVYNKLENKNYNIVISDLLMPGVDGLTLGDYIKNNYKDIYFCIMTGFSNGIKNEQRKIIDYILKKPMDLKELENMKKEYEIYMRANVKEE